MDCSLPRRAQEETAAKASLRRQVIHLAQRLQLEAHEQYSWPPPALPAEHEPTRRSPVLGSGADERSWTRSPEQRTLSPTDQLRQLHAYRPTAAVAEQRQQAMTPLEGPTRLTRHNATRGRCKPLGDRFSESLVRIAACGPLGHGTGPHWPKPALSADPYHAPTDILCCVAVYSAASGLLVLVVFSGEVSVAASAVSCDRRLDFKGSGYPARALLTAQAAPQRFVRRKVRRCAAVQ